MKFNKKNYNIYLTSAIIAAGLIYMGMSALYINKNVMSQTSADIAIDKRIDACYAEKGLDH